MNRMPNNNLADFLDHYCERTAAGLWNEPFNLLSNLAFIAAGILVWRLLRQQRRPMTGPVWDISVLTVLLLVIGIGSGLWHMFASGWSLMADSIPILLFINIYLLSCLIRVFSLSIAMSLTLFIIYHLVNYSIQAALPGDFLNRSIFYLPTWVFLSGITLTVWKQQRVAYHYYINAFVIFTVALVLRTLDQSVCSFLPAGTHFVWHILNATALYLLMHGLIANAAGHTVRPAS